LVYFLEARPSHGGNEMERFDKAQKLFGSFQKDGEFQNLRKSLDILDELMEIQGTEAQRATKLKENIGHYVDSQMQGFYRKANLDDFSKGLTSDEVVLLLFESLSQKDLTRFAQLLGIKTDYFG
jgi:hypothetical protein